MDAFTTTLSIVSTICAIVFGYIALVRNRDKDKVHEAQSGATILTELGYIKSGIDDVKVEQRELRKFNTDFAERIVAVEASAKQAHKRIDRLEHEHERHEQS